MSQLDHHASDARIAEWQLGGLGEADRQSLEAHLAGCPTCTTRTELISGLLATPNDLPIDLAERLSTPSRIGRALANAAQPAPRAPLAWRWPAVAIAAGAAALVIAFIVPRSGSEWPVVVEGARPGYEMKGATAFSATEPTVFRLPDQSMVRAARGTRLAGAKKGKAWRIEEGRADFEIKPQGADRFAVETDEAEVSVVGTVFSVERPGIGATVVTVVSGKVSVLNRLTGATAMLSSGETLRAAKAEPPPPPPAEVVSPAPTITEPEPAPRIQEIRRSIRRGELPKAKALMRRAQKTLRTRAERAELSIVAAEIFLAEKRFGSAVRAYERVVRDFPGTVQAESALYAAAQVALDHPESGASGADLLRRYVASYPRGRFRSEAEGMLRVLQR